MLVCCFCVLREFVATSVPHHFAVGLAWTLDFLVCSLVVYLSLVTLVRYGFLKIIFCTLPYYRGNTGRYAHIFHRFIFEEFGMSDDFFVWFIRGVTAIISAMRIALLVFMQQEPRYVILKNISDSTAILKVTRGFFKF